MSESKISIIIPVYNFEKYLRECLDSCVNQTLEDIEIICVDDCSTDNSYKILEEYQQKDSRIKIFRHKENKNQGAARNTGLANATGEYVWFIDSDDYIDTKACQILYEAIKEFDVDLLCFSALKFVDEDKKHHFFYDKYYHQGLQINKIYRPKTNWKEIKFSNLNVSACMYLTKTSLIQNFKFREGVFFEDTDFTTILLTSVDSFCYIPYAAYFYRMNPTSTMQTPITQEKLDHVEACMKSLEKFVTEKNLSKRHFLYKFLVDQIDLNLKLYGSNQNIEKGKLATLILMEKKYRTLYSFARKSLRKLLHKY